MKLKLFFALVALSSVGCSHAYKHYTADIVNRGYAKECVDGVNYLIFGSSGDDGILFKTANNYSPVVQVDREGKPVPCEAKSK